MAFPIPNHVYLLGEGKADPVTTDRGTDLMRQMLLNQYQLSDNLLEYYDAFFSEMDFLLENVEAVYAGRFLDNAVGSQLDVIGVILGQPRGVPLDSIWFGFEGVDDVDGFSSEVNPTSGGLFRSEQNLGFEIEPLDDATYRSVLYARAVLSNQDTCDITLVYFICTILLEKQVSQFNLRTSDSLIDPTPERHVILELSVDEVVDKQVTLIEYMAQFFIPDGVTFSVELLVSTAQFHFEFDGVDQHAAMPNWVPLGLPFTVSAQAKLRTVNGSPRRLFSGTSNVLNVQVLADQYNGSWQDRTNTGRAIAFIDPAIQGELVNPTFSATALQTQFTVNGLQVGSNSNVANVLGTNQIDTIGANGGRSTTFWHGPIWDLYMTDGSPIQDTTALMGNGVRYINIPEFVIPSTDAGRFTFEAIRTGDGAAWGSDDTSNYLLVQGVNIKLLVAGVNYQFTNAALNLAAGQHFHASVYFDGTDWQCSVDGAADIPATLSGRGGDIRCTQLYGFRPATPNPTGFVLQNVTLENTTTGDYLQYKIDEGSGTVVVGYDEVGDPALSANKVPADFDAGWFNITVSGTSAWNLVAGSATCNSDGNLDLTNTGGFAGFEDDIYKVTIEVASNTGTAPISTNPYGAQWEFISNDRPLDTTITQIDAGKVGTFVFYYRKINTNSAQMGLRALNGTICDIASITMEQVLEGTITPDADWEFIKGNSRHYPMNEGAGDTFYDSLNMADLGPDEWDEPSIVLGDGWTDNLDGTYSCDGSQGAASNILTDARPTVGNPYRVTMTVLERSAGTVRAKTGSIGDSPRSTIGVFVEDIVPINTGQHLIQANDTFVGRVSAEIIFEELLSGGDTEAKIQNYSGNWAV